jgi:hypothetical protein
VTDVGGDANAARSGNGRGARGHITIRNRGGLELAACECYEAMEREWKIRMGLRSPRQVIYGRAPIYRGYGKQNANL